MRVGGGGSLANSGLDTKFCDATFDILALRVRWDHQFFLVFQRTKEVQIAQCNETNILKQTFQPPITSF